MSATAPAPAAGPDLAALDAVQRRVLWLATATVHHANKRRPNPSGIKGGGHQASSASMVSLMTALWFAHLQAPDPVDFSTGSVGIGATQTIWSAIAHRYLAGHVEVPVGGRQIALLGDAELDEGAVWEAVADPMVPRLGEVLWVVDLNRQSLDRVVPDIAFGRLAGMFEAAGWQVLTVKYGRRLEALYERAGGEDLRRRIDEMPNEEYQRLLRAEADELRERLPGRNAGLR